jgi:hypothetical protein
MVERNLTIPHKFICVTDEKIDGIECVPLEWEKHVPGTVYLRLMMRRPDIAELLGDRIFMLDLDVVITGNIDEIVSRPEPSVFFRNPNFPLPHRAFYQSSIQLFDAGSNSELYTDFEPDRTPENMNWKEPHKEVLPVNWRFGGREQAWISEKLPWDLPYWDGKDGIYGAGRLGGVGIGTHLPENAKIVTVPGNREPSQPEVQELHPWMKEHYR